MEYLHQETYMKDIRLENNLRFFPDLTHFARLPPMPFNGKFSIETATLLFSVEQIYRDRMESLFFLIPMPSFCFGLLLWRPPVIRCSLLWWTASPSLVSLSKRRCLLRLSNWMCHVIVRWLADLTPLLCLHAYTTLRHLYFIRFLNLHSLIPFLHSFYNTL